jgi:putative CocE/NonD family hydrolase
MVMSYRDDRDAEFWSERRLIDRFGQVTAAALLLHGFQDVPRIAWQEDLVWEALTAAPKRQVEGQWEHEWPSHKGGLVSPAPPHDPDPTWGYSFEQLLYDWYDFWLKGIGPVPDGLGTVDYEDDAGEWRRAGSWPPGEAGDEALYLSGESLVATGEPGFRSYSTALNPLDYFRHDPVEFATDIGHPDVGWWAALCRDDAMAAAGEPGVVYTTAVVDEPVVLGGNPHAWLHLVSDQPGGVVDVRLMDLGPDFGCDDQGRPVDARQIAAGAADLRFHAGNFVAADFPVGSSTPVRVDFPSLATRLETGHRLALVLSTGEGYSKFTPLHYPTIGVVAGPEADASHIVLPVVEGTLGGAPDPDVAPPRPFGPGWSSR